MKRLIITFLFALFAAAALAQHQEPEKGDIGALVSSKFQSEEDAMRFVVREILFKHNIVPETYDAGLGYIVTERFYYQGWLNCQLVMMFTTSGEGVTVRIVGRDYNTNRGEGMHSGPMSYGKGMKGSPVEAYWSFLMLVAETIPHDSVEYFGK